MEELVYTSAPQGLQPGSSGFCTVEMTEGMPPDMMDSLEALSAYDNDPSKAVNWMHVQFNSMRGMRHVLSRVGPLSGEFSGRTNKLAHHICLAPNELPPQGPMRVVGLGGPLQQTWSGQVRHLSPQASPTKLRVASMPRPCKTWEAAVGDAGVAGAILSKLRSSVSSPLWVIRTPAMDALMMTDEILALLSGQERWRFTFCTYLHTLPRSVECRLRWVLPDSPAMAQVQSMGPDQLVDLRQGAESVLRGVDSRMVDAARSGKAVVGSGPSPTVRMSKAAPTGPSLRRGVSPVNLSQLAPSDAAKQTLPPPPPTQQVSPLRWVMLGLGIGSIPACLLLFLLISSDPASVAAMRELEAEQQSNQPPPAAPTVEPEVEPSPEPEPEVKPPPERDKKPNPEEKRDEKPPPVVDPGPKIRSEIPIDRLVGLRLPTSALSLSLDQQTIHQGKGVYDISLLKVPDIQRNFEFEITDPDYAGVRDLIAVASTGQQKKMGTIYVEPDRVMFAWSPDTSRGVAAAFVLTHEFLIKDETHHNKIQFEFASSPSTFPSPPIPRKDFEFPVPGWVLSQFEILVRPTVYSTASDQKVTFDPFVVVAPTSETKTFEKKLNLAALEEAMVREAKFFVWADLVGGAIGAKGTVLLESGVRRRWQTI